MARLRASILLASLLVACGTAAPDGGDGGGDGGSGAGGDGGGGSTLSDGSIGSSCTTGCDAGLTCETTAPGGYCSRTCTAEADCAPAGHCYNLQGASGPVQACLRGCGDDLDCREGYTCQGDAGNTICYPGDDGGGGCLSEANLVGNWMPTCGGSCEELRFAPDHTVYYGYWTAASGNTESYGDWTLTCPTLTVRLTSGYWAPATYTYTVTATGFHEQASDPWGKCSGTCM